MRYIAVLVISFGVSFYLAEVLSKVRWWKIHHSQIGLVLFFTGLSLYFFNPILATISVAVGLGLMMHHLMSEGFLLSDRIERSFLRRHEAKIERALEILPGALTWTALTTPIWLSFVFPLAVAYLILLADVYWLFTAVRISTQTFMGLKKMKQAEKVDWQKRLEEDFPDEWGRFYHLIVLPAYNESLEVLAPAFQAVANSKYPKNKIWLGVGFEERMQLKDPDKIARNIDYLNSFKDKVGGVLASIHPVNLPGEVPGPGTNRNWMIKNAVKVFREKGILPDDVLVTTLDADFVIHPQFLAGALHKYLSTPENVRDKRSFTGTFLYNNNYWSAPTPMRVIASGTAFWQLSEMVGSDKYINFSSLSMNLKSLLDIGGWIPDKVNDDSGFFWKAYYHFKGDYKVIPHYLPITADTVLDVTTWKTIQNQYLQLKRWAYGAEHVPFIILQYFKNRDMKFWDRTDKVTFIMWAYFKWGTLALFITFGGLIIPLINPAYTQSVVYYNLSVTSSWILTLAFIGLFTTVFVNEQVAPPRPKNWPFIIWAWSYIQWFLVPIVLITITSIPAIDAQTSLMIGRYIEFRTTVKARLKA